MTRIAPKARAKKLLAKLDAEDQRRFARPLRFSDLGLTADDVAALEKALFPELPTKE